MSDDGPENLVLRYLRDIDRKVDRLDRRLDEQTARIAILETTMVAIRRDVAELYGVYVSMANRLDGMDKRLDRIERRLDLIPATAA